MSSYTETKHACDNCEKQLTTHSNHVVIQTSKDENSYGWRRLRVTVELHHGVHNDGTQELADLCQQCAIKLLEDALKRVRAGERSSAGVEEIEMCKFPKAQAKP